MCSFLGSYRISVSWNFLGRYYLLAMVAVVGTRWRQSQPGDHTQWIFIYWHRITDDFIDGHLILLFDANIFFRQIELKRKSKGQINGWSVYPFSIELLSIESGFFNPTLGTQRVKHISPTGTKTRFNWSFRSHFEFWACGVFLGDHFKASSADIILLKSFHK